MPIRRTVNLSASSTNGRRIALLGALIAGLTLIAFSPSLRDGFTNWDDPQSVVDNRDIRGINFEKVKKVFSSTYLCNYQPVTMLTYMAEYRLFGLDSAAYHRTNLLVHICNAIIVFLLILSLRESRAAAFVAALLFAIHPLRVESVAWIAERKDVLSAFFYLLSLLLYVKFLRKKNLRYYLLCFFSLVMALLSKPMAVSQPFVLLLFDYLANRRITLRVMAEKLPFFFVASGFAILAFIIQRGSGAIHEYPSMLAAQRLCVPFYGLVFYLTKFILPIHLSAVYPFPIKPDPAMAVRLYGAPVVTVVIALAIALYHGPLKKILVFASLFYLVTLLPVLQIIPIGVSMVADRYSYIPMIGFALLCGAAGEQFLRSTKKDHRAYGLWMTLPIGIFFIFICLTFQRCRVWEDNFSLWNDAINNFPQSALQGYLNRGLAYCDKKQYDKGIEDFSKAIALKPDYGSAIANRAAAFEVIGAHERAIADFSRAIRLDSGNIKAINARGLAYDNIGMHDLAIADFTRVLALDSRHPLANNERGIAYGSIGQYNLAIADFTRALELDATNLNARANRGIVFATIGNWDRAIADLSTVIAQDPNYAETVYANRGIAFLQKGLYNPAIRDLKIALSMNGDDPIALQACARAVACLNAAPPVSSPKALSVPK
jgi:tetratricopeptide (TPR) repeat protein